MGERNQPNAMTAEEREIWRAAYAASYVVEWRYTQYIAETYRRPGDTEPAFDKAMRAMSAETPGFIADQAVRDFRSWREHENSALGIVVETTDAE